MEGSWTFQAGCLEHDIPVHLENFRGNSLLAGGGARYLQFK